MTRDAELPTRPDAAVAAYRRLGLVGLCAAAALVWLAFADFGVAVPTISRDLGGSLPALQWANNAFSLVTGALVLAAGRFGDLYGRRQMLRIGLVVFGAAAFVTAFAPGVSLLIAGRAVMGVGAALILPATLALIPPMFPRDEQPGAFGAWMAVAWVGQGAGPAIGGFFTSVVGWRAIFWINAPLALVALWLVARAVPESRDADARPGIDYLGIATSALAAFALLFALTAGQDRGFGDPLIIGSLVAAVVLGLAFVVIEKRLANPLVDMALFRSRPFDGALAANTVMNLVFAGMSFVLTIYFQDVKGHSPVVAGCLLLPSIITILIFNPIGRHLSLSRGARLPVLLGTATLGAGTLVTSVLGSHYSYWLVACGLLIIGVGVGLLSTPVSDTAVAGPPPELAGTASGTFKMTSMLGGSIGVALLVAVQQGSEGREAQRRATAAGLSPDQVDLLKRSVVDSKVADQVLASVDPATRATLQAAYRGVEAMGIESALRVAGVLAIWGCAAILWLWRSRAPT
jgi:EmrB/QacA subfamily drug resistance transporter